MFRDRGSSMLKQARCAQPKRISTASSYHKFGNMTSASAQCSSKKYG